VLPGAQAVMLATRNSEMGTQLAKPLGNLMSM
jgi:hypothetical protein